MRNLQSALVCILMLTSAACGTEASSDNTSKLASEHFFIRPASGPEFGGLAILTAKESRPDRLELSLSGTTETELIAVHAFLDPAVVRDQRYTFRVVHLRAATLGEATLSRCPVADPASCAFGEGGEVAASRGARIDGTITDTSPRLAGSFEGDYIFECFVVSDAPGGPDGGHNADTNETAGLVQDIGLNSDFCRQFRDL